MASPAENKLGTMPVKRLLLSMSLPMVVSFLIQALYNVVDSIFVAMISESALMAVSLAFPVQNLIIAVAVGTGVGVNALLSRKLGEGNRTEASLAAGNGLILALLSSVVFAVAGWLFSPAFIGIFTKDVSIIQMGGSYLQICCVFSFGVFGQIMAQRIMQSTGNTLYNMITQGIGAIINLILDPILIFGWFGLPAMGVEGAALATIIGQIVAMVLAVVINMIFNKDISLAKWAFKPNKSIIKEIYVVGFPSIIMQSISSFMTFGVNHILIKFTETAVSVFNIYFKLQSFIFMPVFGLTNGLIPIVSYNYGAKRRDRIEEAIKSGIIWSMVIMLVGTIIFQIFADKLLLLFNASSHMINIGVPALQIISIGFVCAGFSIIVSSIFQALGNGTLSLIMSIIRQVAGIMPIAWLLGQFGDVSLVWWAFPISEIMSLVTAAILYGRMHAKIIQPLSKLTIVEKEPLIAKTEY